MNNESRVLQIPIEDIVPNKFQPRINFDENALNELSKSIKEHGIIQPLVLRKIGDKYEIIAGERRYKAAILAGLDKVPCIINQLDDNKSAEVAIVENIQRKNLNAVEEAKSYKNLLDKGYITQEELAKKMGISQSAISNKLRLLLLDEEVQDALMNGKISERHARSLLQIHNKEKQKVWLKRIIEERITVRDLEKRIKEDVEEDLDISNIVNPDIEKIISSSTDILNPFEGNAYLDEKKEVNETKFFNNLESTSISMNMKEEEIEFLDFEQEENNDLEKIKEFIKSLNNPKISYKELDLGNEKQINIIIK